jgi:PleD family two-component response regulator
VADSAGDDDSPEVVLKRADQALYRAKTKGRNQVSR